MMLTPQAFRLLADAVTALHDIDAESRWRNWVSQSPTGDLPYDVAEIALRALVATERKLEADLEGDAVDEDTEANILNHLGYIQSIQRGLRSEGIGR